MGHYIGLRFTAKLKPEFVNVVALLLEAGKATRSAWFCVALWTPTAEFLLPWSQQDRAAQIPFGQNMPTDREGENVLDGDIWRVCCGTKNGQTLQYFLEKVLPRMCLDVPFCEIEIEDGHPAFREVGTFDTVDLTLSPLSRALQELERRIIPSEEEANE